MKKLLLLFLLLVVSCDNSTEPDDNSIRGYVKDSQGNAISEAAVLLTYTFGELPRFNTTITYNLAQDGHVLVWITEMCGDDTVKVLVNANQTVGSYTISWNADDSNGNTVVDGVYLRYMKTLDGIKIQKYFLLQLFFDHLEMIDGKLGYTQHNWETQQDTFYTQNYHAMTDKDGYFSISLDCLAFDSGELIGMDEQGNPTGTKSILYKTKLWIIHEGDSTFVTDWYDVDPDNGVELDITAPY